MENTIANQLPTDIAFEKQLGQLATWVRVMRQAGLPIEEALQMPIDDPEMRKRLVRFWNSGGYESTMTQTTMTQKLARAIGIPVFGIEEAVQHFGVKPTRAQLSALAEIPFTEVELRECKDTHILVAVFPMSIIEIRGKVPANQRLFCDQDWYNKEAFAKDRGEIGWHLIRKTPVENSTNKTWNDQQALRGKRIDIGFTNRSLSAFKKNDLSPAARGFIILFFTKSGKVHGDSLCRLIAYAKPSGDKGR